MKIPFYFAITSMIVLSSCSDNEIFTTSEVAKTPITIDVYQQGQTRVTETTIDVLQTSTTGFKFVAMYGTEALINADAKYSTTDNKWSYGDDIVYWPVKENTTPTVSFYGFYSPNTNDVLDVTNDKATINVDGASDVVFASVLSQTEPNDGAAISLSFKHIMSKVAVSAKGKDDGFNYTVTNVSFTAPSSIDFKLSDESIVANTSSQDTNIPLVLKNANGVSAPYHASDYTLLTDDIILPSYDMTMTIKYDVVDARQTTTHLTKTARITPTIGCMNNINITLPSDRTPISLSISSVFGWDPTSSEPTLN